jgi:predicted PurR-regulated permease PerM
MPDPMTTAILKLLSPLIKLATLALVVAMLARGEVLLVPIALAVVIAFALTPLVKALERIGLARFLCVLVVVLAMLGLVSSFGYVVSRQFVDLSIQMPKYSEVMGRKLAALRTPGKSSLANIPKTVDKVVQDLDNRVSEDLRAQRVRVVPEQATALERFQAIIAPALGPAARAIIVLVLTIFMLTKREDLRNRFIRLVGQGSVTLATRTIDDAARRISRYLMVQSLLNLGFGALVFASLSLIGVPYALLWGAIAAVLRFVPYVGSTIAMVLPAAIAFSQFEGWWHLFATVGTFIGIDLVMAYLVEPLVIGAKTGVSSLALLVMTFFWTWIWGPLGLVLATPLTACLAVIGKQVPRLNFLGVLLGDEAPLAPHVVLYQRLLARDEDEALETMEEQLAHHCRRDVLERTFLPALSLAERDLARQEISTDEHAFILQSLHTILVSCGNGEALPAPAGFARLRRKEALGTEPARSGSGEPRFSILIAPARSDADALTAELASEAFRVLAVEVETMAASALTSEVCAMVKAGSPDLICIPAVPPGGVAHVRSLCKHLRLARPAVRLVVFRPGEPVDRGEEARTVGRMVEAGADRVVFRLSDLAAEGRLVLQLAKARDEEPTRARAGSPS